MMGTKERHFAPLITRSLVELVPPGHFYRPLHRTLELSFVYAFVKQTYAGGGRPSIDPVVFFKLQLVMFFEGLRSERQLMRQAAHRLSVRWYVGYDLQRTSDFKVSTTDADATPMRLKGAARIWGIIPTLSSMAAKRASSSRGW